MARIFLRNRAWGVAALLVVAGGFGLYWQLSRDGDTSPSATHLGAAEGFNVLLVTLDTTRADRLGCYGYVGADTPHLDGLAARGVRYDHAVTTAPVTLPAHASILTGLYPPNHGVRNNAEFTLDAGHVTLAEILSQRGYDTAAFIASFVLDGRFGLNQGFDHYDDRMPTPQRGFGKNQERSADVVTDAVIDWLTARDDASPFFAWVHYYDPHDPYQVRDERFRDRPYDGEITYMDRQLGRLLDAIEVPERTLIVVVGDHGESLGEHGEAGHSRLIYDAVMRVPLILVCPGLAPGQVVDDRVVCVTDVFPTVLDLLGVSSETPGDGVSLLEPAGTRERGVYMESMVTYLDNGWAPLFGLRTRDAKFILAPRSEYYDLAVDPHELSNLYDDLSASRLESVLVDMLQGWPSPEEVASAAATLDAETADRLESLGYISGDTSAVEIGIHDPKDMMPIWEKMGSAKKRSAAGDQAAAVALLIEVVAAWPNDRTALRQLGIYHLRGGDRQEAEKALRRAIEIKPAADVCLLLAQITVADGRFDETEPLLQLAKSVEPRHGGVHITRGDLLSAQGFHEKAIASYEQAEQIDPYRSRGVTRQRIERERRLIAESSSTP